MLELKNLTKIYHTEDEGSLALKSISIAFPEKGFVAVTGESGSGKTTLLNVLSGFASYEEGDFLVDGVDFLAFSEDDLEKYRRHDIGFVFQDYHLIENYTVIDNLISALLAVGVSYHEAKKRSIAYLKEFKLIELKNAKARNISSGQKQKLSIARAMIKEPKIVLCDEPTANLDPENSILVLEILEKYSHDHLVILSTHNYDDAQNYATHFVRIYNGVLTSYEQIKDIDNSEHKPEENKKDQSLKLFGLSVKNQPIKAFSKMAFFAFFIAAFVMLLALFSANIDDASTRVLSRKTFNNINQNELIVMRKDRNIVNEDELVSLRDINHVTGTQLYGLATEMNYFYRDGIDYEYRINIVLVNVGDYHTDVTVEKTEKVFTVLKDDMYIKEWKGMVEESDLKEGHLPEQYNEVVVYGDYKIGDEILVYLHDPVLQGTSYLKLNFVVSGLLKEPHEDLFFSPVFLQAIDYIQYHSTENLFKFNLSYRKWNKIKYAYENKTMSFPLVPIHNPSLGPNEIQLSKNLLSKLTEGFPEDEYINNAYIIYKDRDGYRYDVDLAKDLFTDEITSGYIYVGENVMHTYADDHTSSVARVFVDNYPYVDDVITRLVDKSYDCLSEYRASSTEYDPDKQVQRAIILILSLSLVVVEAFAYYIFGSLFERGKLNDDTTLLLLGSSRSTMKKASLFGIIFTQILAFALGIGLFFIVSSFKIPFITGVVQYLRFYHFLIILAIVAVINFFIWWKYNRRLSESVKSRRVG